MLYVLYLIAFLLSCGCQCSVSLPTRPCVGLWYLIVAFSNHTHLHYNNNAGADPGFLKRRCVGGCFADFI